MSLALLHSQIPKSAPDVRRNLQILDRDQALDRATKWAIILASASATQCARLIMLVRDCAGGAVSRAVEEAAQAAASTMALQCVYGSLARMDTHSEYAAMPARLDTSALDDPPVDMTLFEYCCLAVLAVAGSSANMRDYEIALRHRGVSTEVVHAIVRYAAIMKSTAVALNIAAAFESHAAEQPKRARRSGAAHRIEKKRPA